LSSAPAVIAVRGLPLSAAAARNLKAGGSTALLPLVKESATEFQSAHSGVNIAVSGGGSYVGIAQAAAGQADIGDSDVVAPGNSGLVDHKVAVVGFALIVNPSTGVTRLSSKQIRDIFAGRVANWNQVGGKDGQIVVINRPRSSGTRAVFKSTLMGVSQITESGLTVDSSGTVVTTVATTPGSISYVALGYAKNKPVTIVRGVKSRCARRRSDAVVSINGRSASRFTPRVYHHRPAPAEKNSTPHAIRTLRSTVMMMVTSGKIETLTPYHRPPCGWVPSRLKSKRVNSLGGRPPNPRRVPGVRAGAATLAAEPPGGEPKPGPLPPGNDGRMYGPSASNAWRVTGLETETRKPLRRK